MKTLAAEQCELIDAVVAERDVGNITAAIFEKDAHITDALRALFERPLQTKGAELIFCGATSLSKGFGWTHRMSEDLDLKVCSPTELSRGARKQVRVEVQALLESIGLATEPTKWKKHDDSRQVVMEWRYQSHYDSATALRPHLQVELRFENIRRQPTACPVRTLLSAQIEAEALMASPGETASVACQHAGETLAEKVMAYLRRSLTPVSERERSLARHLHDVHAIMVENPEALDVAASLFPDIAAQEQRTYSRQLGNAASLRPTLESALAMTADQEVLRAEYERDVTPLLSSRDQTRFDDILAGYQRAAQR